MTGEGVEEIEGHSAPPLSHPVEGGKAAVRLVPPAGIWTLEVHHAIAAHGQSRMREAEGRGEARR